jgi:outer membrane protein assembly factor BamD
MKTKTALIPCLSATRRATGPALVVLVGLVLGGCGSMGGLFSDNNVPKEITGTPDEIYAQGDQRLNTGHYTVAAAYFEEVDRQHPYSPLAGKAIVMAAYAYYKDSKYDDAINAAQRYVTLHPGTKEAALAQFIISSSYFDRIKDPSRDQTATKRALQELQLLVRRYPDSRYVEQVENRIRIANDVLAAQEMEVGRYYLKNQNYLAAINRFKTVIDQYQTTKQVEEALARLTEAYMAMGIVNEAQTAAAILGHNFPSSTWYKDSYALLKSGGLEPREDEGSWLSKSFKAVGKALMPG